jgi:hypothetical protein
VDAKGVCIECPAGWTTAESGESSISDCKGACMNSLTHMHGVVTTDKGLVQTLH